MQAHLIISYKKGRLGRPTLGRPKVYSRLFNLPYWAWHSYTAAYTEIFMQLSWIPRVVPKVYYKGKKFRYTQIFLMKYMTIQN